MVAFVTTPAAAEEAILAKARAVEAAQLKALVGSSVELASTGVLMEGKKRHELATWRKIEFAAPAQFLLLWERGLFDGQPVDEEQLREKMAGKKKKMGADLLLSVLAPLTDADVSYLGPAEGGGARLYAVPHHSDKVLSVQIEVDADGRKRSATPRLGGEQFKFADKAEFTMRFSPDGAPLEFHSFVTGHFLWWSRSLEMSGHKLP